MLVPALAPAKDDHAFTGRWVLDKKNSPASPNTPDGLTQEIKEKNGSLVIRSRWQEPKNGMLTLPMVGIAAGEIKLTPDGSTEEESQVGPYTIKSRTKQDGNQLVTEWTAGMNEASVSGQWTRTLSEDQKQMTLEIASKASDGRDITEKLVFRRK